MQNSLNTPLADVRAFVALWQRFRRTRPDIVHTHTSKAGILARAAARLAGVPVIVHTLHSPPFHGRQHPAVRWALRRLETVWAGFTDRIIAVAQRQAAEFAAAGVTRVDKIVVIPSPIDIARIHVARAGDRTGTRRRLEIPEDALLVLSVAELSPDKGHDLLIDAAARLNDPSVVYIIAGGGFARDTLASKIAKRGLAGRVRLLGPRSDVPELLAAADLFVQTSRREGLSRSLVEALSMGLPVVATNVGSTSEIVQDGWNGYLIAPEDATALAGRISELAHDSSLRHRLGANAQGSVGDSRGIDSTNQALDCLYAELTSPGRGSRRTLRPSTAPEFAGSQR